LLYAPLCCSQEGTRPCACVHEHSALSTVQRSRCRDCGSSCICSTIGCGAPVRMWRRRHLRQQQRQHCKDSGIYDHQRRRSQCKECCGRSVCEHKCQRSICKECGGGGICASECEADIKTVMRSTSEQGSRRGK